MRLSSRLHRKSPQKSTSAARWHRKHAGRSLRIESLEERQLLAGGAVFQKDFDFGTSTSAVAPGYIGIHEQSTYSPAVGYGWQSGAAVSPTLFGNLGEPDNDANGTASSAEFRVDVPQAGWYQITAHMGHAESAEGDQQVSLEGRVVDSWNATGGIETRSYQVYIADNQVNLGLACLTQGKVTLIESLSVKQIENLEASFDFGTSSSPVAAGYFRVSESTSYSSALGYGWQTPHYPIFSGAFADYYGQPDNDCNYL